MGAAPGAAIGGTLGVITGGVGGWFAGEAVAKGIYDWYFAPDGIPVDVVVP